MNYELIKFKAAFSLGILSNCQISFPLPAKPISSLFSALTTAIRREYGQYYHHKDVLCFENKDRPGIYSPPQIQ